MGIRVALIIDASQAIILGKTLGLMVIPAGRIEYWDLHFPSGGDRPRVRVS